MTSPIELKNIQGDIVPGLPKKAQSFFFFKIENVDDFRSKLHKLVPLITTAENVSASHEVIRQHRQSHTSLLSVAFLNIAFSAKGLAKLGFNPAEAKDDGFTNGQFADAKELGDDLKQSSNDPDWVPGFKEKIDGVILVAGDSQHSVHNHLNKAVAVLGKTIKEVLNLFGHVRPGKEEGHEHFGFEDGISNPVVKGLAEDLSGQGPVEPGVIFCGRNGDSVTGRPSWALDGSFLAFRLLQQLVPEFDQFLSQNALKVGDPTVNGAELLGARLTGRWKSGAPIAVTPLRDDPALAADPQRRNKFQFDPSSQEACPFAAHVRKMNPRGDIPQTTGINPHRVIRRGIQYGPEVSTKERANNRTEKDRGLLFVSYQSSLKDGFQFLQKSWANPTTFPPGKTQQPGQDPLIGQVVDVDNQGARSMSGADPGNAASNLDLGFQKWVVAKGGEYFFSPSIPVLRDVFAAGFTIQGGGEL
ncbi:dye-decolorizing heme-containing peroxidase [Diatrype stigma]|uniref:Dye-decolorizing heme-containing peroxidase n=1 Tax=Diatrype stigma TaxID=117547 RepID=A0AAN9YQL4_9PEZI